MPITNQQDALRSFAQTYEEQLALLKSSGASFSTLESSLQLQLQTEDERCELALADLHAESEKKQHESEERFAELKQTCSAKFQEQRSEIESKAKTEQQQLRAEARDDQDYERAIEIKREQTLTEVTRKQSEFNQRVEDVEQRIEEMIEKLPSLPSGDHRRPSIEIAGTSVFNRLADLKRQVEELNETIATKINALARFKSSALMSILQQLTLLAVVGGIGYVVYHAVQFPNPYIVPSIIGGTWLAFALWLLAVRASAKRKRRDRLLDKVRLSLSFRQAIRGLKDAARKEFDVDHAIKDTVDRLLRKQEREKKDAERRKQKAKKKIDALRSRTQEKMEKVDKEEQDRLKEIETQRAQELDSIQKSLALQCLDCEQSFKDAKQACSDKHRDEREQLIAQRQSSLEIIRSAVADMHAAQRLDVHPWHDDFWKSWKPAFEHTPYIPLGEIEIAENTLLKSCQWPDHDDAELVLRVPVDLITPQQALLLARLPAAQGMQLIHQAMFRMLTNTPVGRARFTLLDPRGLGEHFSQFLRLVDYDEHVVGPKVWTAQNEIEQILAQMTEHAEKVIQKFLRNQYQTLDEYNVAAGDLAEPYQIIVIAEFPHGFSPLAIERLSALLEYGSRCGIFIWIQHDPQKKTPKGLGLSPFQDQGLSIAAEDGRAYVDLGILEECSLQMEAMPAQVLADQLLDKIGSGVATAANRALPMEVGAPAVAGEQWSSNSESILRIPIGRSGAERLQYLELGVGTAQHVLIGGRTGSGKSTLLHIIITCGALWYGPDQLQFYLVDFKKGVEFKTYASNNFPHARVIAVESDREYALSVLRTIDAELERRGALFRKAEVQDLAGFRAARPDEFMPRSVLVIDEFHEFFTEDDGIARDAALLLERFVRQGRAFGVHIILGSQSIAGSMSLARSAIGQIGVRIALQCNESDSQLILSEENAAARLLERPGEAIYNGRSGQVDGNDPFQVFWLSEEEQNAYLQKISSQAPSDLPATWVFEGNVPAHIVENKELIKLMDEPYSTETQKPHCWLGEPNAIRGPVEVKFDSRPGSNLLVVGHNREAVYGMVQGSLLSLAARYPSDAVRLMVVDGDDPDPRLRERLKGFAEALPHQVDYLDAAAGVQAISELGAEVEDGKAANALPTFVFILGFGRLRALRQVDDFSFGAQDKEKDPGQRFADLLENGPEQGIHSIVWCESANVTSTAFQRATMRNFELRLLFQMSSGDSSDLIDDGNASRLGLHHALLCDLESLQRDKFRPYVLTELEEGQELAKRLNKA
jgi:ABC-type multidrug transport system fused ATPase/permease subunit